MSHAFNAGALNPYIAASVGVIGNEYLSFSHYVTPEVGVMMGRWFFYTQFSYYRYTDDVDPKTDVYEFTKYPALSFGIGFSW